MLEIDLINFLSPGREFLCSLLMTVCVSLLICNKVLFFPTLVMFALHCSQSNWLMGFIDDITNDIANHCSKE